ncbi:TetR family transcriptional regulator [Cohnella sp. CFH 77786]|nr:TetR family transcriptional regulator [Cohnella sp. CFH 77786]
MQPEQKVDPRILRTRKLILDAFMTIAKTKDFASISIKDITDAATVNRATFYAHFADKYELLDAVLTDTFFKNMHEHLNCHDRLNEDTVANVFLAITRFQKELSVQWKKSYESFRPIIENKIKKDLEGLFYLLLTNQNLAVEKEKLKIWSVLLSWEIYGACTDWQQNSTLPAEKYIKTAMPYILQGMAVLV